MSDSKTREPSRLSIALRAIAALVLGTAAINVFNLAVNTSAVAIGLLPAELTDPRTLVQEVLLQLQFFGAGVVGAIVVGWVAAVRPGLHVLVIGSVWFAMDVAALVFGPLADASLVVRGAILLAVAPQMWIGLTLARRWRATRPDR